VESAWRAAVETLVGLGAAPVDVSFTAIGDAQRVGMTILRTEMATFHADWFARQPADYGDSARERFAAARALGAIDFVQAQRAREPIRAEQWTVFDQVDVLVTPAMPMTAARIGSDVVQVNGRTFDAATQATRFTYPFNVSGFPAMSVPCGFDRHGLPIGLQLAAAPWQEALLLRVAHQYQQATEWHKARPPREAVTVSLSP
jgi:aspartyl-tRNA(Asn)/glutamyl-tRNA(Gln) amidotransferase subunit A